MNTRTILIIIALALLALIAFMLLRPKATVEGPVVTPVATSTPQTPPAEEEVEPVGIPNLIQVGSPAANQRISSPVTVTGSARGTWYFEASFPIEVRNSAGSVIAQGHAEAQSNWMTEDFVLFNGTVTFPKQPAGSKGSVVLKKDNPSGDPERDQQVVIPITFE